MSRIVEKLAATELSSHIGTIDKTRNRAPNHPFSAYMYSLVAATIFSTILHARSIPAELIHAKHLILHQLESPSKCSQVYANCLLGLYIKYGRKSSCDL